MMLTAGYSAADCGFDIPDSYFSDKFYVMCYTVDSDLLLKILLI